MKHGVRYEPRAVWATAGARRAVARLDRRAGRGARPGKLPGVPIEEHRVAERQEAVAARRSAVSYSVRQRGPTKASIIISSVVRGRWKLVSRTSTTWNVEPRCRNSSVRPSSCPDAAALSRARTRGRADGDDPVGGAARLPCGLGHAVALTVHGVVERVGRGDRLERVQADGELDRVDGDSPFPVISLDQLGGQVQPGRRRGGRARSPGIDGLVALGPIEAGRDVGRQRHLTDPVERLDIVQLDPERVAGRRSARGPWRRCARLRRGDPRRREVGAPAAPSPPTSSTPSASSSSTSTAPPVARRSRSRAAAPWCR